MAISQARKLEIIKDFGGTLKNAGSIEIQIALLTESINELTKHLLVNKKDYISKRGLFIKVSQRKALLNYLTSKDINRARELTKRLKIHNK